jgi:hypothetical protein
VETSNDFSLADPRANQVLQKVRAELAVTTKWRYLARPVSVSFPAANTQVEVLHQLGEIPDGYDVVIADAAIRRVPGKQWTKQIAYLMSDQNNSSATLAFGVLREAPLNVDAH